MRCRHEQAVEQVVTSASSSGISAKPSCPTITPSVPLVWDLYCRSHRVYSAGTYFVLNRRRGPQGLRESSFASSMTASDWLTWGTMLFVGSRIRCSFIVAEKTRLDSRGGTKATLGDGCRQVCVFFACCYNRQEGD